MISTDDNNIRREALALLRELHAILILASEIDKEWVGLLNQLRLQVATSEASKLLARKEWLECKVVEARGAYGIKADRETLSEFLHEGPQHGSRHDVLHSQG